MLSWYSLVLFIHILAAVMGLGTAFGFPLLARSAKNATQAKFTLELLKNMEIMPKVGSITLLLTGIILAIQEPDLFTTGWYIASIVLYLLAQVIVIGMFPKFANAQMAVLENHRTEDIPSEFRVIGKKSLQWELVTHFLAFLLILLMVFKPTF
ncbi:DUF2269 family protein [Paenibacillus glycanilyticus]|uniref:DUF2269 family protein n=1 Tax=Paenibacillus glycanilyticus TaxID=126569 RepID=A0ABQ6GID8_9BACL|nr:DUF2269 family protein [Paenibacillus glycanilyticus]GLX70025.1 hypothetical protein MU1_43710 [Paenibacillus glycanilyticus]